MKCLRGWFSTKFTQLWLPWKGLNNQIKIDAEPKLKTMIKKYNASNEIAFLQLDLGSYKVMALDTIPTNTSQDQNKEPKMPTPKSEIVTQFIDSMVTNLQCLGEEADPSILLLLGFFRLHKVSHSKFECSSCQEAVAKVLTQIMENKGKETSADELTESQNSINSSHHVEKTKEENEDLNMSYSDTSLDGGGLSPPPPRMIKVQRRR